MAEDNEGHARLIQKNLTRAGIVNTIIHFKDGQEVLDFLYNNSNDRHMQYGQPYLLLLDIHMPRVDGVGVLGKIKNDRELCKIPVIMLTTSNNPIEIKRCHHLGCSYYIAKPVQYDSFVNVVKSLGCFLDIVKVPSITKQDFN